MLVLDSKASTVVARHPGRPLAKRSLGDLDNNQGVLKEETLDGSFAASCSHLAEHEFPQYAIVEDSIYKSCMSLPHYASRLANFIFADAEELDLSKLVS